MCSALLSVDALTVPNVDDDVLEAARAYVLDVALGVLLAPENEPGLRDRMASATDWLAAHEELRRLAAHLLREAGHMAVVERRHAAVDAPGLCEPLSEEAEGS